MWKRKKKKSERIDPTVAEPGPGDAPTEAHPRERARGNDAPTQPLHRGEADREAGSIPPDEAPTQPLRSPKATRPLGSEAPTRPADPAEATLVAQLETAAGDTAKGNTDPAPEQPRPAEPDAPTVAIRPEFERKLPDPPEPIPETDPAAADDGATVQVGRPVKGSAAANGDNEAVAPDETGDEPTVPLERRKTS